MKKIRRVVFALLLLCGFCFVVSCKTEVQPNPDNQTEATKKALEDISIDTTNVKKEYYLGQSFDSNGIKAEAKFNDNTSLDISSDVIIQSDSFDSNSIGEYLIIVSYTYEGRVRTENYTVQVKSIIDELEKYIVGLELSLGKTTYNVNEDLILTDLEVNAVLSDGTTEKLEDGSYTVDQQFIDKTKGNVSPLVVSTKKSYQSNQATQEVEVKSFIMITYLNPLVSLAFKEGTTEFEYGTKFSTEDWKIEATYTNGEVKTITDFIVNKRVNTHLSGQQTVTVSYTEMYVSKTCSVDVTVAANPNPDAAFKYELNANDLEPVNPRNESLEVGDFFTITGNASKPIRIDANSKSFGEEFAFTRRINFQGTASAESRSVKILMPKAGTIRVIFSQGNVGRKIGLWDSNWNQLGTSTASTGGNNLLVEHVFTVNEAGYYYIGGTSGIYVWYVCIEG